MNDRTAPAPPITVPLDLAADPRSAHRAPILCFSHLRWDFVFQRPQHLLSRFAKDRAVYVFEETWWIGDDEPARLDLRTCETSGVVVARPHIPGGQREREEEILRGLLDGMIHARRIRRPVTWYYTPMMLPFSRHIETAAVVYDCMDELSQFRFAPPTLLALEAELFDRADVVFTGGISIYEAKKDRNPNVHAFPSSVDKAHFAAARTLVHADLPTDLRDIESPRLGYYGVIDERLDYGLIAAVADAHPEWSVVMVGPLAKVAAEDLPRRPNIHWLGGRSYAELPRYLGGWDIALMPFALNEATRFISPTKTPEYLSGGRAVVSTRIRDVERTYGGLEAVAIAYSPAEFVAGCERQMALGRSGAWLDAVDAQLKDLSWDATKSRMSALVDVAVARRRPPVAQPAAPTVLPSNRRPHYDVLVVGAGFAGSVLAERLAADADKRVLVIDRRPHIAGNAFDHYDEAGILIHKYGPHIFHTNSDDVASYLSRFTKWRPYEHRVLASVRDQLVPMPINRTTLNALFGLSLNTDEDAAAYLASRAEPVGKIETSRDVVISVVGRELYETFFQGYTRKQWGMDPSELDKSVTARVPTRTNIDDRYFTDSFQKMPSMGYTRMFENMLDHHNIDLDLGVDWADVKKEVRAERLVFTGPVDEYFGHRFGKLPYRSLHFDHQTLDREQFQSVGTVNFPDEDVLYTRVSEYKHLTGQQHRKTSITYEYPRAEGDPYYPIPRPENQALYKRYEALALATPEVTFAGRLATYRYYNMDQVVGQALSTYRKLVNREGLPSRMAGNDDAPVRPAAASA